jgi:hypothetical protein
LASLTAGSISPIRRSAALTEFCKITPVWQSLSQPTIGCVPSIVSA